MRYILFLIVLLMSFSTLAQTPISKKTANAYYNNCVSKIAPNPMLTPQSQTMLCACTAAKMTNGPFTMEDMAAMGHAQNPALQRGSFNKMLVEVYAPCMEAPAYDYYYGTCMQNPQTSQYGDRQSICNCLGSSMALHMRTNGQTVFANILRRNPNITDPMAAMIDDPQFMAFAQNQLTACLK